MGTPDENRLERIEKAHAIADLKKRKWESAKSEAKLCKEEWVEACDKRDSIIAHEEQDDLPVEVDDMGRPIHATHGYVDPADVE